MSTGFFTKKEDRQMNACLLVNYFILAILPSPFYELQRKGFPLDLLCQNSYEKQDMPCLYL